MNKIQFVGYDGTHEEPFNYIINGKEDMYIILLIASASYITIDGVKKNYPEGTAVVLTPGTHIEYGSNGEIFRDNWLWLYSDETILSAFPRTNRPFVITDFEYLHSIFKLLTWETSSYTNTNRFLHHSGEGIPDDAFRFKENLENDNIENNDVISDKMHGRSLIDDLIKILIEKLNNELKKTDFGPHSDSLYSLRNQMEKTPAQHWTINEMATYTCTSEGYLQLLYKKQFGISCMEDLINIRMKKAKDYLAFTSYPISKIAELCGYDSIEHFSRQFKQRNGMSPLKYRQRML